MDGGKGCGVGGVYRWMCEEDGPAGVAIITYIFGRGSYGDGAGELWLAAVAYWVGIDKQVSCESRVSI